MGCGCLCRGREWGCGQSPGTQDGVADLSEGRGALNVAGSLQPLSDCRLFAMNFPGVPQVGEERGEYGFGVRTASSCCMSFWTIVVLGGLCGGILKMFLIPLDFKDLSDRLHCSLGGGFVEMGSCYQSHSCGYCADWLHDPGCHMVQAALKNHCGGFSGVGTTASVPCLN